MLILVRKVQQGIWIDGDIYIKVLNVERDRVKLGITAPDSVKVMRQELSDAAPPGDPGEGGEPRANAGQPRNGPAPPQKPARP